MLAEIREFYEELNIFWKEEAFRAAEVFKERRTDLRDFECWNSFYSSLKLAIEFWKVCYFTSTVHFSSNQNDPFRISHRVVMLKTNVAIMHSLLQSVQSPFHFCISSYYPYRRELISQ